MGPGRTRPSTVKACFGAFAGGLVALLVAVLCIQPETGRSQTGEEVLSRDQGVRLVALLDSDPSDPGDATGPARESGAAPSPAYSLRIAFPTEAGPFPDRRRIGPFGRAPPLA